ncbi:hypothetical protein Agabi119p4_10074 [Agaricus bisporus var. burnettii]|uniref:Uncharacterized protein n=1 Tax=Agaricus bisporus var. burnettii TaxID=192524 RepID=A0A8H7C294_AGABI|nr:hypothetical protein Agabi119p4_10074 [Agaricus bisporus var. burnettii]
MNPDRSYPRDANGQNSRSALTGQSSQQFVGGDAPFSGVGLQNNQDITWNPQIPYTQYYHYPSIFLPSLEAPTFGQQLPPPTVKTPPIKVPPETSAALTAADSHQPEKQPKPQGLFVLLTTTENLVKYGERIFENVDQHISIYARITASPRQHRNGTYYVLNIVGQEQTLKGDLYLAFGFIKGHLHVDFSSAVCKTFFLRRFRASIRGNKNPGQCIYKVQRFARGVEGLHRSQAKSILTSKFEEKARAAYWRNFQHFSLNCQGNGRVTMDLAIGGSTAGPSISGSTQPLGPAVANAIQHGQQEREDPRGQFSEPPPAARQPQSQPSFLEEATSVALYQPSTSSRPLPHESTSYWAYPDSQGITLGNNASAFTMQGGLAATMPVYPTSTSVPQWYMDYVSNLMLQGAGIDVSIPGPDHRTTSDYTNYDISYHHTPATHIPILDQGVQAPNYSMNYSYYPSVNVEQADVSQINVLSNAVVPASASSRQGPIQVNIEPAPFPAPTPHFVPPPPSVPTPAPPAPVKTRKRGRPRRNKEKEPQVFNSYPPSTSSEQAPDPAKTGNIHVHEPGPSTTPLHNNVVATEAQTSNSAPPGMFFPASQSGFHYPPSYNDYQPGLIPQPFTFTYTYASPAASHSWNFGVPTLPSSQTQQSNLEGLPQVDDMNRDWWNHDLQNFFGEGFQ